MLETIEALLMLGVFLAFLGFTIIIFYYLMQRKP